MKKDPAIDSIRETRHKISERFGHDTRALVTHYIALEEKYRDRMVNKAAELTTEKKDAE